MVITIIINPKRDDHTYTQYRISMQDRIDGMKERRKADN